MSKEDKEMEARFVESFEAEKRKRSKEVLTTKEQKEEYDFSCSLKFDAFLDCNSPKGQIYNIYRYGQPLSCMEQVDDLIFCLKVKLKDPEEAKIIYYERLKEKAEKAPVDSQPPIWTMRTVPPPNFPPKIPET